MPGCIADEPRDREVEASCRLQFFRRPTVGRELFIKDWPEGTLWDVDQNSNADAQDDDERAEFRERPRGTGFTIAGDATQMPGANFKECD
jgi:hypothetical protein